MDALDTEQIVNDHRGRPQIANADISDLTELRCLGYDIADSDLSGFTEDSLLSADVQTDIPYVCSGCCGLAL